MGEKPLNRAKIKSEISKLKEREIKQAELIEKLEANGVYFVDKNHVVIYGDIEIGKDTIIYPDVVIEGKVKIGEGNILYPGTRIKDSEIGNFNDIQATVVLESKLGNESYYGPFAYIRPGSVIGDQVKIGDFVEIKKSSIGDGTKVSHLTYLGDAEIGKNINFGCGTVIVNYDGVNKYKTIVEDNAFIGCNTNLVSPVRVGKNAYTAAGSTITEDVPEESLAIARNRQENKEGWTRKKGRVK